MLNLIWVLKILIHRLHGVLNRQLDVNLEIREEVRTGDPSCKSHQLKPTGVHYSDLQFGFEERVGGGNGAVMPIFYGKIIP